MIVKHYWLLQLDICLNMLFWKYGNKAAEIMEEITIHIPEYRSLLINENVEYGSLLRLDSHRQCTIKEQVDKLREKYSKTGNILFQRLEKYITHQEDDVPYTEIENAYRDYIKRKFKYFKIAQML